MLNVKESICLVQYVYCRMNTRLCRFRVLWTRISTAGVGISNLFFLFQAFDNNIITLEVKKSNRGRNKAGRSSNSSVSTNKASDRSSCQHTAAIRRSSRHDHCCIVCQIAGKPHTSVMNAQHYASQVLTSAERHTQGKFEYVFYSSGKHSLFLVKQGLTCSGERRYFVK